MDIAKPKQKKSLWWKLSVLALTITLILLSTHYLRNIVQADFAVEGDSLRFAVVKRGEFKVTVRGSGVLAAEKIQWLSGNVEALVEDIRVKPGKTVKKGDVIIVLSNPQLNQQLSETQWELEAMEAESRAQQSDQESRLLDQESLVLDAELNFESSKLRLNAQNHLLAKSKGSIPQIDFERTQLETIQFKKRWSNQEKRYVKMLDNLKVQNGARSARLKKMRKTLERMQLQVDNLKVKAGMDSIVQEVPLEIGQRVSMGSRLAKLAQKDSYIAELKIPELLINDVQAGQSVTIDTRNNTLRGRITRVDPIVVNGNVQVDAEIVGDLPSDVRPDMSITGEVLVSNIADALYVARPVFSQSKSRTSIYRVDKNSPIARRVVVEFGLGSVNQIQVESGLNEGDEIVISDSSAWSANERIYIK